MNSEAGFSEMLVEVGFVVRPNAAKGQEVDLAIASTEVSMFVSAQ